MSTVAISMRFKSQTWSIRDLLGAYNDKSRLDINPHYQRNSVWTLAAQRRLIGTIEDGYPIPAFFMHDRGNNRLEMVDGQQRCRAIVSFAAGDFSSARGCRVAVVERKSTDLAYVAAFLSYPLHVCIIDRDVTHGAIEEFYVLVNSSAVRLNSAELRKADFYHTRFLRLATEVAGHELFQDLDVFTEKATDRMNDIDFVSELLTFLKWGYSDKKDKVDATYESDVKDEEAEQLKARALMVLSKLTRLDKIAPIRRTRFKQKGDLLTLFAFVEQNTEMPTDLLEFVYRSLLRLAPHIRPSQDACDPLMEYARNCVSQSNSKDARQARHALLEALFNNRGRTLNETQLSIAAYFGILQDAAIHRWDRLLLPHSAMVRPE
jgi:hypothetical protein